MNVMINICQPLNLLSVLGFKVTYSNMLPCEFLYIQYANKITNAEKYSILITYVQSHLLSVLLGKSGRKDAYLRGRGMK